MMEVQASLHDNRWPVKIHPLRAPGNYVITGRGTEMWIAVRPSGGIGGGSHLIAVINFNRCGCLDADKWSAADVQQYIGIENPVDAATLAAALNVILGRNQENGVAGTTWKKPYGRYKWQ
ncbi:hypothetical protein J2Z49_001480 [Desulfofundulus luciae]|uniref:Uncharacterized protein n=1 Tax=Desulfofundulus luciae TaxID=74702 RepID=A0ABU0B0W7_9FIRM|nr:hypothetical protein [Desulfofundulus luciae]MDQ0286366.1 hypothetical protein [Desulfofundulus luciae]